MTAPESATARATVIGAGLVGLATALYLRRAGFEVRLIERDEPGQGASYGNAGVIAVDSVVPVAMPGILRRVPRMLLDSRSPLAVRWSYLPRLTPWLIRFLAASRPAEVERISIALRQICERAMAAYRPLLDDGEGAALVRHGGWLAVYESDAGFADDQAGLELRRRRGVEYHVLAQPEIRQAEPALGPSIKHAVHFPGYSWVIDPLRLSQSLADQLRRKGAEIVRANVTGFEVGGDGPRQMFTDGATFDVAGDVVVLTAGAHSRPLARQLGAVVPLDTERGYHVMLPDPGIELRMPVAHGERGFVATTMANGLRLAGTVELGGLTAPPNWSRSDVLADHASRMFPGLNAAGAERWMGFRPSFPDSLPVIGPSPRHAKVFLAFGHGHLGLTLAAVTGEMVAAMAQGRRPAVDPTPFRADRF